MENIEIDKFIKKNSYEKIRIRGKQLYKTNKVLEINNNNSEIKAFVQGTYLYQVTIKTNDDKIKSASCNCPYDYGGICKHAVAVLYKLQENPPEIDNKFKKKHNSSEWFLIAENNNFSLKEISKSFAFSNSRFQKLEVSILIEKDFVSLKLKDWRVNNIDFKIENDNLYTKCDCHFEETLLCSHQINAINALKKVTADDFFTEIKSENIQKLIEKEAEEYGIAQNSDMLNYFAPKFSDGKIIIIPTEKLDGLISSNKHENNTLNSFLKDIEQKKPFLGQSKTTSEEFEIGFLFKNKTSYRDFSFTEVIPFTGKLNKKGDKLINPLREILDNRSNNISFTYLDEEIFKIANQTSFENLSNFLYRNNIDLSNIEEIQKHISIYYEDIYSELSKLLINKKFLYYQNEEFSKSPFKISQTKPKLFFELSENEDFFEFSLKVKIEDKIFTAKELKQQYFPPMLLVIKGMGYFFNNSQDDLLFFTSINQSSTLKASKNNFDALFSNYVIPISRKYDIDINLKTIKFEEKMSVKKLKQIYISEVSKFVIFTPIVLYDGEFQANILDKGKIMSYYHNRITSIFREIEYEKEFLTFVKTLHPNFLKQTMLDYYYLTFEEFLDNYWFFDAFEKITEAGIEVFGLDKLSKLKYNPNKAKVAVQIKSNIDWFEVDVKVAFGDINVSLKDIRKAILKKDRYIKLSDGTLGVLPEEWIEKFEAYFRQGEIKNEKINVSKLKFNIIEQLFKDQDYSEIIKEITEKKKKLKEFSSIKKIELPENLEGTLRDYQKAGYNWLNFLEEFKWGGILADDMGLGKTIQVISFLLKTHSQKRNASLVVVPTTLLFNWENELQKFAPTLKVNFHYGTGRESEKLDIKNNDIIITTYGIMTRDAQLLKKYKFSYIILDESQAIKNPESLRFKAAMLLKADNKIAMTGTPIENNTFDLYAQMEFLNPGFLGTKTMFKEMYSDPIDKGQNSKVAQELQKVVNPFIIRRTKEQVATELPDKTENYMFCEMAENQRKVYDAFRNKYRNMLLNKIDEDGLGKAKIYVIEGLMKLRQICDSPAILSDDEDYGNESVKINELIRHIKEKTGNHKILVFSQFVKMLSQIKNKLNDENIIFEYLDGKSSQKQRQESVQNFQENDKIRVFLISLKAGGTGINLTSADYVFLVDPWWNPAVENQAIDRTHRIGQDKKVIAYRMICKNTIEEKIMKYQERKLKVASDIISTEENFVKQLSKDDISDLFS
ncbi:MAG: DEAD/DEAH box helicase family protein [Bacteroidales bacterium]|nr:DEAD/DEAH box helicase family protein [Bacteroidales bacterium]